ncbi:hypothetical protein KIW84_030077 [Lathyrus oleraceus]|uniref:Uncharacterized protein n=1 Tax=Pisum sativum TaxID=3888 RepID=A0A9D4XRF9_PEA|nr:hypothetical protein KIW84_030077 [Pisum sativum]
MSTKGPTIHFFRALANDDAKLTWGKLKDALLERYGELHKGTSQSNFPFCSNRISWRSIFVNLRSRVTHVKPKGMIGKREQRESKHIGNGPPTRSEHKTDRKGNTAWDRVVKHLSYHENNIKRKQKGLCFKCGGLFHPRHQCLGEKIVSHDAEDDDTADGEALVLAVKTEGNDSKEGEMSVMTIVKKCGLA